MMHGVSGSEAPVEEVARNLFTARFDIAREVRGVGVGESLGLVEVDRGL